MPGAGIFTKGPVLHFVVIPQYSATQAFFLGTSVTSPKKRGERYEIPIFNDLGGRSAAFQTAADGEEWKVFTTLNRFDMSVIRSLRYLRSGVKFAGGTFPNPAAFPLTGLTPPLGSENGFGRGSLVIGAQDFKLILVNSYAGTLAAGLPVTAAVDMANATGFASCSLPAEEEDDDATRATEISLAIQTRNVFIPSTVIDPNTRGFVTYSEGVPTTFPPGITLGPIS